jgi:hypothetical protein
MGIVGCVKNGPKKATYEPWEGSATCHCMDTLRSVKEKNTEKKKPRNAPISAHQNGSHYASLDSGDAIVRVLIQGVGALNFFQIFYSVALQFACYSSHSQRLISA